MRIWLATIGEPVPVGEGFADRLHRTGQFAQYLAENGNKVVWWTSAFDHFSKKHHFPVDTVLQASENLEIKLLHGCGYSSNISYSRIKDQKQIAKKFAQQARNEAEKPDIILSSLPTIELCDEATKYGREFGVPVVLDMRDMWPDILVDAFPGPAKPIAQMMLKPMFNQAARACERADAIIGITDDFVDWGIAKTKRQRKSADQAFPFAYVTKSLDPEKITQAEIHWDSLNITKESNDFVVCFFGTISHQLDVDTMINAAKILKTAKPHVKFVICGTGDKLEYYKEMAAGLGNVVFPGWVNAAQIRVLMSRSSLGLDPMPNRYDFLATINNKALEYMSAGLPVISSPKDGVLYRLLDANNCGISYDQGDAEALASVISSLADDPNRLKELSNNSASLFTNSFTLDKVCGAMMQYLLQMSSK